jgi:chemotaxis protein methyltransferase CheR
MIGNGSADWKLLTDLVAERFGLSFEGARREILESRIQPRIGALHLHDFQEYYHYLTVHPGREAEFGELARRLTNNETYFFREPQHLEILLKHVIPGLAPGLNGAPLRLLSIGCSSGEEPYSINVRLVDSGWGLNGLRWEIDAGDLNPGRIEQARAGVYDPLSLRICDDDVRRHCFVEENGRFRLRDRYRNGVRFFPVNIAAPIAGLMGAPYQAIFCRNMLIYFSDDAFAAVIARLERALAPGGYLFLGAAESLIDRTPAFEPLFLEGAMVYRRRPEPR